MWRPRSPAAIAPMCGSVDLLYRDHDARAVQSSEAEVIAIFDFDETLVSIDTGSAFIHWMIRRSKLRTALAALALPLAGPLLFVPKARLLGISVFLWIGTVGHGRSGFDELCDEFGRAFGEAHGSGRALALVVEALREHDRAHPSTPDSGTSPVSRLCFSSR